MPQRTPASAKHVYAFGKKTEGSADQRTLLGGKGANLAEMARIGLPVPPGFTITTAVCNYYSSHKGAYPKALKASVLKELKSVEAQVGKCFGDPQNPLLFSVRSGARESMPGMMDTILNLGLNDATVEGLATATGDARFAYDSYRRFIQMYGSVVLGIDSQGIRDEEPFEALFSVFKKEVGVKEDSKLTAKHLKQLIERYKHLVHSRTRRPFPQDVMEQLWGAIGAVFDSWNNERARIYRQRYSIPSSIGTAVNVQSMVFGNRGETSATGVAFTRDPATGENVFYGEYLINAQGEDVVAGVRTPNPIAQMEQEMPGTFKQLKRVCSILEKHFRDMQDFEFTVEEGTLYMLQTRSGKRTGLAAIRIAIEMVKSRLINVKEAIRRIPADSIDSLLVPVFKTSSLKRARYIAKGLPAGPGAASGKIVFDAQEAERLAEQGSKVILCRNETSPEDLRGMIASEGILTARGGVSSHAALVARQMGKVCVTGVQELKINYERGVLIAGKQRLREGDTISIDGSTGEVFMGLIETQPSEVTQVLSGKMKPEKSQAYQLFNQVMQWADKYRRLNVRTNADTPEQAQRSMTLGAEGVGLCRTEHMFFEGDRIALMREMILAQESEVREVVLKKLLPLQRKDFSGIFKAMKGRPVTIRLLDPPLHEFLPSEDAARRDLASSLGVSSRIIAERSRALEEENPMLGHRGCRLGVTYPEITRMQVQAIFEAAASVIGGKKPIPVELEIMVPLVAYHGELEHQVALIREVADAVMKKKGVKIHYLVGTMVEVPRAALQASEIAETAEFFSFGTNDLTQTGLGMSRDDAGTFLPRYSDLEIVEQNPFMTIDRGGVGRLVEFACEGGRKTRSRIKLGVCGEHGGDPSSIGFFEEVGLDYVSCSPPRIPVARLAAAQAALAHEN